MLKSHGIAPVRPTSLLVICQTCSIRLLIKTELHVHPYAQLCKSETKRDHSRYKGETGCDHVTYKTESDDVRALIMLVTKDKSGAVHVRYESETASDHVR